MNVKTTTPPTAVAAHRPRPAFTLIELIIALLVLSLLGGVVSFGYGSIMSRARSDQATQVLDSVAAAEGAWYSGHASFVAATVCGSEAPACNPAADNTRASAMLRRIAGGGDLGRITYVDYTQVPPPVNDAGVWTVSAGRSHAANGWPVVGLVTMSSDGKCVGAMVVSPYADLKAFGPIDVGPGTATNLGACSAGALLDALGAVGR